jgi:hypothetical protein
VKLSFNKLYSTETRILFDIRRLLRTVLILYFSLVGVFIVVVGVIWAQLAHYELLSRNNMNQLNARVMDILSNVKSVTGTGVPIATNLNTATTALAAAAAALANLNVSAGRHLLTADAAVADYEQTGPDARVRQMVYQQVHGLLLDSRAKVNSFNFTSVSYALTSFGDLLQWVINDVEYGVLEEIYLRTLTDMERASNFGVLFTSVLGMSAAAANITSPSALSLMGSALSLG